MKFKVLLRDTDPTRSSIQLAMADGVSASSSSEDERERSGSPPRPKKTKKVNRLFVWLPKRLKATPRGSHWDKLNRDGSVKEIEELTDLFVVLIFGRIRFYMTLSRGNEIQIQGGNCCPGTRMPLPEERSSSYKKGHIKVGEFLCYKIFIYCK